MADVDTRPQIMNVSHYAGDTLTIKVTAPVEVTTGMVWNAQVRADREDATPIDASFVITPPSPGTDPAAYLVLTSADCRRLAGTGTVVRARSRRTGQMAAVQRYAGEWDCQISHATNPDPVITLVQGTLTLDLDVTRLP